MTEEAEEKRTVARHDLPNAVDAQLEALRDTPPTELTRARLTVRSHFSEAVAVETKHADAPDRQPDVSP
jgi:hypothetical protein